ncbi:uncharacterized protein LAESUDRAFT_729286 [Laetiporus sulphureus 93-53]|uniref:GST N-terminal domain-containing protein n=1 Tax=Laetiporus sulphureus 93-53 TaxID=1314785 RepID=A0A165CQS6_9APHY|nr:uncharacterized protein LAESUDRAFT_729286 [Laetiporus sulphureus 93-53]KZT03253.1 hypothetical protein LAESUDRAFT_729286 [Laetiporus sulphureus 93-53]
MAFKHFITLYDVRSTLDPPAWSPNVWKVRFILNFKRLPYCTQFLAYPDIAGVLSSVGAPPTRAEMPQYTVPAILDEAEGSSPLALSDSSHIAMHLDKTYPEPSIFPGGCHREQMRYAAAIHKHVMLPMLHMVVPSTVDILEGRDLDYYLATREGFLGIALEDMFPPHKQQAVWDGILRGLDELAALIDSSRDHRAGPWMFSPVENPSYADFVLGAMLIWFRRAGPRGCWDRICRRNDGKWEHLLQILEPYMEVL